MAALPSDQIGVIRARFASNLDRVRSIVEVYDRLGTRAKGRRSVRDSDLLRSAVVLLHATTEDLLRSLAEAILPSAGRDVLASLRIPFVVGTGEKSEKVSLSELSAHRGQSVDDVISRMIREWLGRSSYNNLREVKVILRAMGLPPDLVRPFDTRLASLMRRRHLIVHRADRNDASGPGHHRVQSIKRSLVVAWVRDVEAFGAGLLDEVARGLSG